MGPPFCVGLKTDLEALKCDGLGVPTAVGPAFLPVHPSDQGLALAAHDHEAPR